MEKLWVTIRLKFDELDRCQCNLLKWERLSKEQFREQNIEFHFNRLIFRGLEEI